MTIDVTRRQAHIPPDFSESLPVDVPEIVEETRISEPWRVILFNDDVHTFDEVIYQIMVAISCTMNRAAEMAWQVHTTGKVVVLAGEFEDCFRVQAVLREIELITELRG
ncbi:MAG: ATP-dependent Clp protease adaptor ClpS [Rhodothermia bacterium]